MSETEKPHLVLNWTMDCVNHRLWIQIAPNLSYEALDGGNLGFTKTFNGETSHVSLEDWEWVEKPWISETYGETYGYYRRCDDLVTIHPERGWEQGCLHGLGRDGEYLDSLQRSQYVLEGHDCASVWLCDGVGNSSPTFDFYSTPDKGLTIFVRLGYNDVLYPEAQDHPEWKWVMHPQPDSRQPRTLSYQLSSYEELEDAGCPVEVVDKCRAGEWDDPPRPELQQYYIYPTP